MHHQNIIRTLHRTDAVTAQNIMEQYPAQWDMDRVFRKTYQKYLAAKQAEMQGAALTDTAAENAVCRNQRTNAQRFWKAGGYAVCAAAYLGIFLFILRTNGQQGEIPKIPQESSDIPHTDTITEPPTTAPVQGTHTQPPTAAQTSMETIMDTIETTSQTSTELTDAPTEATETEPTAQTDAPETQSEPAIEVTDTPETSAVQTEPETTPDTTTATTETTPEATAETTTTAAAAGHFEVDETAPAGQFRNVRYVRTEDTPVEERVHGFAAEGFTVTRTEEVNGEHDFRSMNYFIEDTDGQQHYVVQQFRYDYFGVSISPSHLWRTYEIAGKPVIIIYEENPESLCTLLWDDGCHVCLMNSQYKDLAKMELLMQGQITD